MNPRLPALVLLGLAFVLSACGGEPELTPKAQLAENAWQAIRKEHTATSYDLFIRTNRMAALEHGSENDTAGIRFQVRALEVQAEESLRSSDIQVALDVQSRVDQLIEGGLLEVYEEELPGSRVRFEAARAKATQALGEE